MGEQVQILATRPLADSAVTLDLAATPGTDAARIVGAAQAALSAAIAAGDLPGAMEAAPAFCSVTIHYDCLLVTQDGLVTRIAALLAGVTPGAEGEGRRWLLPCCYDDGIDLPDLSAYLGLSVGAIAERHAATVFRVHALGFLPGLPFLGELPPEIARPRRAEPRTAVPAGAVAIANRMCVIYPWVSPGGWHIVGNCPVPLFDISRPVPALLSVGDSLRFRAVSASEAAALRANPPDPSTLLERAR